MAVYRFRLTFDKYPQFMREYEIEDINTLYALHRCIQNDLDFDEAQLAVFFTSDELWEKCKAYPLFDMGEGAMDMITFEQLFTEGVSRLLYVFDLYNDRAFKLEFVEEVEPSRLASYPNVAMAKNDPPDQLIDSNPPAAMPFIEGEGSESFIDDEEDSEDDDDYKEDNDEPSDEEIEELFEESEGQ